MSVFTTVTITGEPDGYRHSEPKKIEARTTREAARFHDEQMRDADDLREMCVLVTSEDESVGHRGEGRLMLTRVSPDGVRAHSAVTKAARDITERMLKISEDIQSLPKPHARSLMRLLESIYLDTSTGTTRSTPRPLSTA